MICNFHKVLAGLLFSFCVICAKAQVPALTIGEAYNWQIGDTFIYQSSYWEFDEWSPSLEDTFVGNPVGFTIVSKVSFADSVNYTIRYFDDSTVSIAIDNLDSSVSTLNNFPPIAIDTTCGPPENDNTFGYPLYLCNDTTFYDTDFYNRKVFAQNCPGFGYSLSVQMVEIAGGLGAFNFLVAYSATSDPTPLNGCGFYLSYYHSGSLIWSNISAPETQASARIFPNPTNGLISIVPPAKQTNEISSIIVYDMLSRPVLTSKINNYSTIIPVDLSGASNGMYLIAFYDKDGQVLSRQQIVKQ